MPKQVEKRLDDLEKKAIPEGEYQVIVSWDDPRFPDKINEGDEVIYITWGENDDIIDPVRVMLWIYPDEPGVYYDQPPGDLPGYRKAKKYNEADRRALECAIGEECVVIKP